MQAIPRWRNWLNLRYSTNLSTTQVSNFHSTSACNDKWKKNGNSDNKKGHQQSKNNTRFAVRQKRADTKKALKSLLFNCRDIGPDFQKGERAWKRFGTSSVDAADGGKPSSSTKKEQPKSESRRAQKIYNHRMRRKFRKGCLSDDDDDDYAEKVFHAKFGNNFFSWSFNSSTSSSQSSTHGFDWRKTFHRLDEASFEWKEENDTDTEEEACYVGSRSDRAVLGLPIKGPLNIKEVKHAFHLSALKWHPDKHQGPSQAAAEEKFKLCVNAYKSLCSALPPA